MRAKEAAAYLRVSKRTLESWISQRIIPFARVGRVRLFRRDDVDAALSRLTVGPLGAAPVTTVTAASAPRSPLRIVHRPAQGRHGGMQSLGSLLATPKRHKSDRQKQNQSERKATA